MTIKEIEELTGMTRANIRFYEAEGFITPVRNTNGYRDYSQTDADILKKIKLLRSLHLSLEEIKELHVGSQNLSDTLEQHIIRLSAQKDELDNAQKICAKMHRDGVSYQTLNTEKYWNAYTQIADSSDELAQDTIPPVRSPWRRFFARALDEALYSFLWNMLLIFVFRINIADMGTGGTILNLVVILILTLFLEPLQLLLFGTTLGKYILGLYIRDNNDRMLSYNEAFTRTSQVLLHGCGLHIPIYELWRNWKCYNTCVYGNTLPWEYDSTLVLKDEKAWRTIVYIGVRILFFIFLLTAAITIQIPTNRGDITVSEFCENYRYLEKYYGFDGSKILNDEGKWQVKKNAGSGVIIYVDEAMSSVEEKQDFNFELSDDGYVRSIAFTLEFVPEAAEDGVWVPTCQEQMLLAALAFVGAQKDFRHFSNDSQNLIEQIGKYTAEDFQFSNAGISISCDVEIIGSAFPVSDFMILKPADNGDCSYYLHFSMQKL